MQQDVWSLRNIARLRALHQFVQRGILEEWHGNGCPITKFFLTLCPTLYPPYPKPVNSPYHLQHDHIR